MTTSLLLSSRRHRLLFSPLLPSLSPLVMRRVSCSPRQYLPSFPDLYKQCSQELPNKESSSAAIVHQKRCPSGPLCSGLLRARAARRAGGKHRNRCPFLLFLYLSCHSRRCGFGIRRRRSCCLISLKVLSSLSPFQPMMLIVDVVAPLSRMQPESREVRL